MKKFLLLSALVCAMSPAAMAWGDAGHNVIVAIAQNHLTPGAKENIRKYIPYDLVRDSRYMDKHRKSPDLLYPGLGEYEIAERLDKVFRRQARQWMKGDFVDWTNDAARTGFRIYEKQRPVWEVPDTPEPKYLPEGYLEDIRDTKNEELLKAGYRLAFLLNKYFD